MRHIWRVYIKPFDELGAYTDWVEVTKEVDFDSLGSIALDLDNTDYDIGVYRNSNIKITLNNTGGKYSDVGAAKSIFKYKRSDSLVKITWEIGPDPALCGMAISGDSFLSEETTIFTGLINDESLAMDLDAQRISFTCLGRESLFSKAIVPFGTLSAGDLVSVAIYKLLNQTLITDLLTVAQINITVNIDQAIDSIAELQNKTVTEGLNKLLLAGNAVLWIDGDTVRVSPRTPSVAVKKVFYGQASAAGVENIQNIKAIKSGLSKTFNLVTWKDVSTLSAQDATSIGKYGARKKELDLEQFTNTTKRQNILNAILAEFKDPKQEFDLFTPFNFYTSDMNLLDKISVDYPTVYMSIDDPLPICGIITCGISVLPRAKWDFTIVPTDYLKVMGRAIDAKTGLLKLKLRRI